MRTIWVIGVVTLCLTSPSLARKKSKDSHVSTATSFFGPQLHQQPYYRSELSNPYYRSELSNPYYRSELPNQYYRSELSNQYLSPALPNPYFGAEVPKHYYYASQNVAPALSKKSKKSKRKVKNSKVLYPIYGADLSSSRYFRADMPYYSAPVALPAIKKKDKKSKRNTKQLTYPVYGRENMYPYFNAEIQQPYYSSQPFYAVNPITNTKDKKSSKKSKRKTKEVAVVYPNFGAGLQTPYYKAELPKLPLFKSEWQFPKLGTQIPCLSNIFKKKDKRFAAEITKPYLRSDIQNPFLNAKLHGSNPYYGADPYFAASPYSRAQLNNIYRRSSPVHPSIPRAAQVIYTGGSGIYSPDFPFSTQDFPFSSPGGITIIRS